MKKRFGPLLLSIGLLGACANSSGPAPAVPAEPTVPAAPSANADDAPPIGLPNERDLASEKIITGGQPTIENLEAAKARGVESVINLRVSGEPGSMADEEARVTTLGMKYVSIPMAGADGVTLDNAKTLYAAISAEGSTPAIVHCGSGNRVGALMALIAFHIEGLDEEAALQKGKAAGLTHLEPKVRAYLEAQGGTAPPPTE